MFHGSIPAISLHIIFTTLKTFFSKKCLYLTRHSCAIFRPNLKNYRRFLIYRKRSFRRVQPDSCISTRLEMTAHQS